MNKPIDYPLKSRSSKSGASGATSDITYAVLRDRVRNEKPVTDEMIRVARTKMDTAHTKSTKATQSKSKLGSLRARFLAN